MAAVAAGVLAGTIVAALGGYAIYKLLSLFRRKGSQVAPSSPPEGRLQAAEKEPRELNVLVPNSSWTVAGSGGSTLQKRKTLPPFSSSDEKGEEWGQQYNRPNTRRSLLAKLDNEALSPAAEQHSLQPVSAVPKPATTSIKPASTTGPQIFTVKFSVSEGPQEPQTAGGVAGESQSYSALPSATVAPQCVAAKYTDSESEEPWSATKPVTVVQEPQIAPEMKDPPIATPFRNATPTTKDGDKLLFSKGAVKPSPGTPATALTTKSGVKLPPGAVSVFSPAMHTMPTTKPSDTPTTASGGAKLPPGAVPVFPPPAPTTLSGIKLPPGAVSVIPPGMALAASQQRNTKEQSGEGGKAKPATPKQAPPPVQPKPKSISKREHATSPFVSSTSPGPKLPRNAVKVLPFQQAPPAKSRKNSSDGTEQTGAKEEGWLDDKENIVSNGIHSNGMLTNGVQINGNLETPISFDQPVHDPGLKVTTRIKGPNRRPPTKF